MAGDSRPPPSKYSSQMSVLRVNPGGTGSPASAIRISVAALAPTTAGSASPARDVSMRTSRVLRRASVGWVTGSPGPK